MIQSAKVLILEKNEKKKKEAKNHSQSQTLLSSSLQTLLLLTFKQAPQVSPWPSSTKRAFSCTYSCIFVT